MKYSPGKRYFPQIQENAGAVMGACAIFSSAGKVGIHTAHVLDRDGREILKYGHLPCYPVYH